jgi:hypothetical protein
MHVDGTPEAIKPSPEVELEQGRARLARLEFLITAVEGLALECALELRDRRLASGQ